MGKFICLPEINWSNLGKFNYWLGWSGVAFWRGQLKGRAELASSSYYVISGHSMWSHQKGCQNFLYVV